VHASVHENSTRMDATDCEAYAVSRICGLEWVSWALDAAHNYNETEDSAGFRLDYASVYADELIGL
jgi:hypothetical protein